MPCLLPVASVLAASAGSLDWRFSGVGDGVARIDVLDERGESRVRLLTADGSGRRQFGWLPDEAEKPGEVAGSLEELWLAPGNWTIQETRPDDGPSRHPTSRKSTWTDETPAPRVVSVRLPPGAEGVIATRLDDERGTTGMAWAPDVGGVAFLPLGQGDWRATAVGATGVNVETIGPGATTVEFRPVRPPGPRPTDHGKTWAVRWLLAPVTLALVAVAGVAGARWISWSRAWLVGVFGAVIMALVSVWPILHGPLTHILMPDPGFSDPVTSATLLAATADSALSLSDVSTSFNWPEGHSWLVLGSSWLSYLLVAPVAWLAGGLAAHNAGLILLLSLLGLSAWALARDHGAGPVAALLATTGALLAPVLVTALDKMSLDRAGLFLVPVFLLCVDRAAVRLQWRWVVGAAAALAGTFYLQTYYGLYLAVACPLLVLPRLLGARPLARLGRLAATGALSMALLAGGLWALKVGTADSVYSQSDPRADAATATLPEAQEVKRFLHAHDPKLGGRKFDRPMATAQERLLTAIAHSSLGVEIAAPGSTFPARSLWWPLVLIALFCAPDRRRSARTIWDVLVLLVLSLGPYLRTADYTVGPPLPYLLAHTGIPGFDQLKHPHRYALLASTLAAVPLAAGLQGLMNRLPARIKAAPKAALTLAIVALSSLLMVGLHTRTPVEAQEAGIPYIDLSSLVSTREYQTLALDYRWPIAQAFPIDDALEGLEPGPAVLLPFAEPTPIPVYVAATQLRLDVVNDAPHGIATRTRIPGWYETNPLLNELARRSGSDRPRTWLGGAVPASAVDELRQAGLAYVILFREHLPMPDMVSDTEALLDAHFPRQAQSDGVVVWRVQGGQP